MTERIQKSLIKEISGFPVVLDKSYVGEFLSGDATPSVRDTNKWKCHSTVVTITNFDDGADGQELFILGNANTTIDNNSNIKTNTGAAKTLAADKVYVFVNFVIAPAKTGVWIEVP